MPPSAPPPCALFRNVLKLLRAEVSFFMLNTHKNRKHGARCAGWRLMGAKLVTGNALRGLRFCKQFLDAEKM